MDGGSCEATYDEEEEEEDDDAGSADGDAHATDETTGTIMRTTKPPV